MPEMRERKGRFVHYTSAEAAHSIISSASIWMRNAACMNDFSEIQYGFKLLTSCLKELGIGDALFGALHSCVPNVSPHAIQVFDEWWDDMQRATYIACLSEHDEREDLYGRLSMWRAYGSRTSASVALVFRLPLETGTAIPLGVAFTPVAYMTPQEVAGQIRQVTDKIKKSATYLGTLDPRTITAIVVTMLRMAVLSLKHPGFDEEREWRVALWPNMPRPTPELVTESTRTIGGVPQKVYSLPLKDAANGGVDGLDIPSILDRVIIGPTQYPVPMVAAFTDALKKVGVPDPESRVSLSHVPLRT
jgi:hypothetical protein